MIVQSEDVLKTHPESVLNIGSVIFMYDVFAFELEGSYPCVYLVLQCYLYFQDFFPIFFSMSQKTSRYNVRTAHNGVLSSNDKELRHNIKK